MTEGVSLQAVGALAGVKVIDLSRVLAGPYAAQMLGDHGAEVIKVEPPRGDITRDWGNEYEAEVSTYYSGLNRNKSHISADLSSEAGQELVLTMLDSADVLVENFLPGTMERWGLGPGYLLKRFPRLVYCRISAFGTEGPMGGLPGFDAVIQAYSGIMHMNGERGRGPVRVPVPITDLTTGLQAFSGILLALFERASSGCGQLVDLSLLDGALSLLHPAAANYFQSGEAPARLGTAHPSISPSDVFRTTDGYLYVAAGTDRQFRKLCEFLEVPYLADDPRFDTNRNRLANNDELTELLSNAVAPLNIGPDTAREMIAAGIPASVVRSLDEVMADPQVAEREMVQVIGGFRVVGIPIKLSRTPGAIRTPPARPGADTRAVLASMGLTADEIDAMIVDGAVTASRHRPEDLADTTAKRIIPGTLPAFG